MAVRVSFRTKIGLKAIIVVADASTFGKFKKKKQGVNGGRDRDIGSEAIIVGPNETISIPIGNEVPSL